jgi:hypothetical protein
LLFLYVSTYIKEKNRFFKKKNKEKKKQGKKKLLRENYGLIYL